MRPGSCHAWVSEIFIQVLCQDPSHTVAVGIAEYAYSLNPDTAHSQTVRRKLPMTIPPPTTISYSGGERDVAPTLRLSNSEEDYLLQHQESTSRCQDRL